MLHSDRYDDGQEKRLKKEQHIDRYSCWISLKCDFASAIDCLNVWVK